jgi:uncharacterized membrane protein YgcG
MNNKFLAYAIIVALLSSLASWSSLARRATGGQGSGNSWHSGTSGPGYSGGGWASGGGGGHK